MPFEAIDPPQNNSLAGHRKIAVIGAGISGMGAAHMLGDDHQVTLFESCPRLGGHARTKMAGKNGDQPVDTGFIVFNYANYPNLAALFKELDVPVVKSNMSFGASIDHDRDAVLVDRDELIAWREANPTEWHANEHLTLP